LVGLQCASITQCPKPTEETVGLYHEGYSLLSTVIEREREGKKTEGRLRMMLLNWVMKEDYRDLNEDLQ